ncbi:hypothetical protein J5X84_27255 [Streptosporangiaceae bacterium NEAU-GS5]|nr:hypothetical protein [Streptosporangiaceae bacterium NEAU-GS5]
MAHEDLVAELAQVNETSWRFSDCGDARVGWLPLVAVSASGLWLGVDREGGWILGRLQGSVVASARDEPMPQPWLTMLDMSESEFRERLDSAAHRHGLSSSDLQQMVPVDDILELGLRSRSTHWAERATRWLVDRPLRDDQIDLLREAATARWASQWTRQTAKKLLSAGHE